MAGNGKVQGRNYEFQPPEIDSKTNRVNTQGQPRANKKFRASFRYANICQPGQTLPVPASGTQFYFRVSTGTIQARPAGGVFSDYAQGQGMQLDDENAFDMLEVRNATTNAIVFEVFIGFQGFIDNQLILSFQTTRVVGFPTAKRASTQAIIDIIDKSGQQFTDINGNQWYALYREAFYVFNPDAAVTLLVKKAASITSNDDAIAVVYPVTSLRLPYSGNYRLNLGGANINAIVSEGYYAIPKVVGP